jgi:hypothetical protein
MSKQTLTFPTGDFSHTDFAKLNNKTNQQVWTVYSEARKTGQIIPANPPERKTAGKGKPTLMWVVNANYVAPVVAVTPATPATPAAVVTGTAATPAPVVDKAAQKAIKDAQKAVDKAAKDAQKAADKLAKAQQKAVDKAAKVAQKAIDKAAKEAAALAQAQPVVGVAAVAPATAPVAETVTVPVVEVAPETVTAPLAEVTPATAPAPEPFVVAAVVAEAPVETTPAQTFQGRPVTDTREITDVCPICGTKCLAADSADGVYVWCPAPIEVCKANENPYGHGNNEKAAFLILTQKYGAK